MYYCDITLELTETIEAEVCVCFYCTYIGYRGNRYDPPEPPEFEVADVEIVTLTGATYDKGGPEIHSAGWYGIVVAKAEEALKNYPDLYDHQLDIYEAQNSWGDNSYRLA